MPSHKSVVKRSKFDWNSAAWVGQVCPETPPPVGRSLGSTAKGNALDTDAGRAGWRTTLRKCCRTSWVFLALDTWPTTLTVSTGLNGVLAISNINTPPD